MSLSLSLCRLVIDGFLSFNTTSLPFFDAASYGWKKEIQKVNFPFLTSTKWRAQKKWFYMDVSLVHTGRPTHIIILICRNILYYHSFLSCLLLCREQTDFAFYLAISNWTWYKIYMYTFIHIILYKYLFYHISLALRFGILTFVHSKTVIVKVVNFLCSSKKKKLETVSFFPCIK